MRKSLLVLATALTTVSCASTPAFQPETVLPDAPARFASEPATLGQTAASNWITALGDPALAGLVEEAFGANPSLAQSLARFDAARASARVAGAGRLPTLNGSLGIDRAEPAGTDSYSFGLSSSWEVDLWGRVRNTANAGTLDAEAAAEDLRAAQLSVAGQVAKSWYALIEARQQTELAERDLQTRRDTLALTERRFARGLVRSSDVRTARSSVASSEAAVASRRRSEAASARTLETLLGRYPAARIAHDGDFPVLDAPSGIGSPQDLLTRRPDVLAAERRLLSAGLRADAARAALFPSLSLSGSTGGGGASLEDALDVDDFVSNLAASLTAPIFRGGQLRAQRDQAQANAELAVASYAQTVLGAWQEAENAIYADTILTERVESLRQAFEEAAAAEELVIRQYARGVSTIFALLDANSRRISAESQYISAQRERVTNRIDLYLAIAGDFAVAGSSEPAMRAGE
jgi:NodT family efflux transporter outer membrane factor (OMF) lipoprotein